MNTKQYWGFVYAGKDKFVKEGKKSVWLASLEKLGSETQAGAVVEATPMRAAQAIIDGTHREATAAEVARWEQEGIERHKVTVAQDRKLARMRGISYE